MAVDFSGGIVVRRNQALLGVANSKKGLLSAWIKAGATPAAAGQILVLESATGTILTFQQSSTDKIIVQGLTAAGATAFQLTSTGAFTPSSGWFHVAASWDLDAPRGQLYINRLANLATFTNNVANVAYESVTTAALGASILSPTQQFKGKFYEVIFWPGLSLNLTTADELAKLVSSDGLTKDYLNPGPVTGIRPIGYDRVRQEQEPAIYFNEYILLNRGTGGAFTAHSGTIAATALDDQPNSYRQSATPGYGQRGERWFDSARGGFSYPKSEITRDPVTGVLVGVDEMDEPSRNWPMVQWDLFVRRSYPEEDREYPPLPGVWGPA